MWEWEVPIGGKCSAKTEVREKTEMYSQCRGFW